MKYGCRVVRNGDRNIERGKAIGLRAATHDLVLFIDDDNELTRNDWLRKAVDAIRECPNAVGAQSCRFAYRRTDSIVNRWASLFGVGDPVAFYLNRRDHLGSLETRWCLSGEVLKETEDYWLVRFDAQDFPTLGSQGYLTWRAMQQSVEHWPHWLHIDANLELAKRGHNQFIFMKDDVVHDYCRSVSQLLNKLKRNAVLFLSAPQERSFEWKRSQLHLLVALVKMLTVVNPTILAVRYYFKTWDTACFMHPVLSFCVPILYAREVLAHSMRGAVRAARARLSPH